MAVHFKFRAEKEYDSINFDGHFITVANLKERIIEQKKLGSNYDFDLAITDAQTSEEYSDDNYPVPRNTSVIIKRVPYARPKPTLHVAQEHKQTPVKVTPDGVDKVKVIQAAKSSAPNTLVPGADSIDDFGGDIYTEVPAVQDDEGKRIAAMVNQASTDWQRQTQEVMGRGRGRGATRGAAGGGRWAYAGRSNAPPAGYICHRCGQAGHFIQHCPTNGDPTYDVKRVKPPSGIPRTRLRIDSDGTYILPDGSVAAMQPDESVFQKEADALLGVRPQAGELPPELRCPLCSGIFRDAVMIPCCGVSFCDQCIRDELIVKGKCPNCGSEKFKNDDLLPNMTLRQAIDRFKESTLAASGDDPFLLPQFRGSGSGPAGSGLMGAPSQVTPPAALGPVSEGGSAGSGAHSRQRQSPKPASVSASAGTAQIDKGGLRKSVTAPASEAMGGASPGHVFAHHAVDMKPNGPREASGVPAPEGHPEMETAGSEGVVSPAVNAADDRDGKGEGEGGTTQEAESAPAASVPNGVAGEQAPAGVTPLALASEGSKGKKKKRKVRQHAYEEAEEDASMYMGQGYGRGGGGSPCFHCGSPHHISVECPSLMGPYPPLPYPGMYGPGGRMLPNPYGPPPGPGYWGPEGPYPPHHHMGYPGMGRGGMFNAPPDLPFDSFHGPPPRYGGYGPLEGPPPFMHPMGHPERPMRGDFMGPDMPFGPERPFHPPGRPAPLREEFQDMQEKARQRRHLKEQSELRQARREAVDRRSLRLSEENDMDGPAPPPPPPPRHYRPSRSPSPSSWPSRSPTPPRREAPSKRTMTRPVEEGDKRRSKPVKSKPQPPVPVDYLSEEETSKKKRKHRKHKEDNEGIREGRVGSRRAIAYKEGSFEADPEVEATARAKSKSKKLKSGKIVRLENRHQDREHDPVDDRWPMETSYAYQKSKSSSKHKHHPSKRD